MENIVLITLLVVAALTFTIAAIAAAVFDFTAVEPAYAPPPMPCENCGASELAPGEDPTAPGWDPSGASADAPGQLAEIPPAPCPACAKDFAAGQEGLKEGIIGPDKKIILD